VLSAAREFGKQRSDLARRRSTHRVDRPALALFDQSHDRFHLGFGGSGILVNRLEPRPPLRPLASSISKNRSLARISRYI